MADAQQHCSWGGGTKANGVFLGWSVVERLGCSSGTAEVDGLFVVQTEEWQGEGQCEGVFSTRAAEEGEESPPMIGE